MKNIRIAVVDDHNIFREGIILVINQIPGFSVVFDTDNGADFLTWLQDETPDIVLMDYSMPGMDGDEVTARALQIRPGLKVIALSMHMDLTHYTLMVDAGVKGFIVKKVSKDELRKAILTVNDGGYYFSSEILEKLAAQSVHSGTFYQKSLTDREKEVLKLLCKGMTTQEISDRLFISIKTVETHRMHIYQKAGVRNVAELIIWAVKNHLFYIG